MNWSKEYWIIQLISPPPQFLFLRRNLQNKINFDDEEQSQYYYSFEQKEDLNDDGNLVTVLNEMKSKLERNPLNRRSTNEFLTEYQDELALALRECIVHHQNIIKVCGMLERFYNLIVLVKSLQVTLQICNFAYVSTTVNFLQLYNIAVCFEKVFSFQTTTSIMQSITYLEYLFLTFVDIMIFGYAGNWIKEQVKIWKIIIRLTVKM